MTKKILYVVIFFFISSSLTLFGQRYEPKKVPSFPRNIQKLAQEVYNELKKTGKPIEVFEREVFALDANDSDIFEFFAHKKIGKSGERSCRFLVIDGEVYYARLIDAETGKNAQGVLYEDMSDKWDRYVKEKERENR
jgi:hypothetical protein